MTIIKKVQYDCKDDNNKVKFDCKYDNNIES